jgi:ATP-dependent DNA helicase RecQ
MRRQVPRKGKSAKRCSPAPAAGVDADLLARLKAWRTEQARDQSVPPYVVFHDSTLSAIAASRPRNLDALSTIAGIGEKKLERYGPALLQVLALNT